MYKNLYEKLQTVDNKLQTDNIYCMLFSYIRISTKVRHLVHFFKNYITHKMDRIN